MKRIVFLSLLLLIGYAGNAQKMRKILKQRTAEACVYGNVGYYGNPHWSVGANIHYLHGIGRGKQRLAIGCGLRANVFFTKKREYTTSSFYLSEINPGGADTLYIPKVNTNTLNAYAAIKINIKPGVDIYFTSDIGGVNFGDSKEAYFRSYETLPYPLELKQKTEPYAFNLNMVSAESYGTIMSEVYGSFRLSKVLLWRLGFNYYRNEYKVINNIDMNGKRFFQNHWMVMSGLAFDIRWQKNLEQLRYRL
ncbi:MAG: hypothetical protein R2831_03135 [Chitinophagaceae bacterium]